MSRKTIVITGCSSGFGRVTALSLAQQGWHVFATVRKEEDRESLRNEATERQAVENLTVLLCDITVEGQVKMLAQQVEVLLREETSDLAGSSGSVPRLDALMNNAGTAYGMPIELIPLEDLRAQFEINVVAHIAVTQAFLPFLKSARGTIINISSISGKTVTPMTGAYSASKFALEALSDALRLELAPFGVKVVLIEPASSPTSIWQTSLQRALDQLGERMEHSPYKPLMQFTIKGAQRAGQSGFPMERVSELVTKILASPKPRARYPVPATASLVVILRRFVPDFLWDRMIRLAFHW